MIDIESLGVREDAVIFQVAAQEFDPLHIGVVGEVYNAFIDIRTQEERKAYPDTIQWWLGQDRHLLARLLFGSVEEPPVPMKEALQGLSSFCKRARGKFVWANSPGFDVSMLRHAGRPHNIDIPIPFYRERDVRTIKSLVTITDQWVDMEMKRAGLSADNKHDARDDVVKQIVQVQIAFQELRIKE